jgi:hypothetical protein
MRIGIVVEVTAAEHIRLKAIVAGTATALKSTSGVPGSY